MGYVIKGKVKFRLFADGTPEETYEARGCLLRSSPGHLPLRFSFFAGSEVVEFSPTVQSFNETMAVVEKNMAPQPRAVRPGVR